MAIDLVDLAKGYLTPDVLQNASSYVGESSGATQKALAGIAPTLISALMNKASTSEGAQQLTRTLDSGKYDGSALGNVKSLFGGGASAPGTLPAGMGLLDSLFGSKLDLIRDLIARSSGVRSDSALSLLAMAMPFVMHVIGQQRALVGSDASSLTDLLGSQRCLLTGLLPAGVASALGWSGVSSAVRDAGSTVREAGSTAVAAASRAAQEVTPARGERSWFAPLAVFGALLLGLLVWLNWPAKESVREAARGATELQLPGGVRLSVPEGSFNFSLAKWLASPTDTRVPKRFVFDDLRFEKDSTELTPESVRTVRNLTAVLKAYPAVSVALEGHTDSTGNASANKQLSLDRADAVKGAMVKGGVAESRITAAGYGQENPIAPNDTEEGRAKNRRLELVVLSR